MRLFAEQYSDDLPMELLFSDELVLWKQYWKKEGREKRDIPDNIADTLTTMRKNGMHIWFPNIYTILVLIACVPSSSCSCEGSISRLRILDTYLRCTMSDDRLNGLALLSIHREIDIDYEKILDIFARNYRHRLQLVDILDETKE